MEIRRFREARENASVDLPGRAIAKAPRLRSASPSA
jgi:hypothetical protein